MVEVKETRILEEEQSGMWVRGVSEIDQYLYQMFRLCFYNQKKHVPMTCVVQEIYYGFKSNYLLGGQCVV
jgi:hypothetical protein